MNRNAFAIALTSCLLAAPACAQSLFMRAVDEPIAPGGRMELRAMSMYLVDPPEPRQFRKHDIIYIIINEASRASSSQSLETNKESTFEDRLNSILDPMKLLQLRLEGVDVTPLQLLDLESRHEFAGDGEYDRDDRIDARIAAEVIDVKPNGNLVLQARKQIDTDGEIKVMLVSGLARQEDVTTANTILSSQMADLRVEMQHEGEVSESAKKGIFTRALETLFAF